MVKNNKNEKEKKCSNKAAADDLRQSRWNLHFLHEKKGEILSRNNRLCHFHNVRCAIIEWANDAANYENHK